MLDNVHIINSCIIVIIIIVLCFHFHSQIALNMFLPSFTFSRTDAFPTDLIILHSSPDPNFEGF